MRANGAMAAGQPASGPGHFASEGSRPGLGRCVGATAPRRPASPRPSHGRHGHMVGASAPRKGPVVAPCQCQAAGRPPARRGDLKPHAARGPGGRGPRSGLGGAVAPASHSPSSDSSQRRLPISPSHRESRVGATTSRRKRTPWPDRSANSLCVFGSTAEAAAASAGDELDDRRQLNISAPACPFTAFSPWARLRPAVFQESLVPGNCLALVAADD